MRNILIHADDGPGMSARLESGLAIGRRHQSHLDLVISSPFQQFIATDPFGGMYLAGEQLAKAQAVDAALERRLRADLEREDVPWEVTLADGDVLSTLTLAATLTDLVIVSLGTADRRRSFAPPMMAGDLAMAVPVPVLAIPETCGPVDLDAPVMIAWNGSAQAAHALRAAVPLIRHARQAVLVTVGGHEGQVAADDALRYLSRHGIHAEWRQVERGVETIEEALERTARDMGAGLIVMGAFGHTRLRETFFGGVTRYLLGSAPAPLLLAH
ncbi:universal stress protein [Sphingopyxis solisilvae]|uniref:universal stress protein n=1 Tax=Sphingopyxis solisilvae TaxID=1886788 RepID=UPI001892AD7A|nr:universal stress protein [Sphingopyxis solisilvae]